LRFIEIRASVVGIDQQAVTSVQPIIDNKTIKLEIGLTTSRSMNNLSAVPAQGRYIHNQVTDSDYYKPFVNTNKLTEHRSSADDF